MTKLVSLRKSGNSMILTVPANFNEKIGKKYSVEKESDGTIVYSPIKKSNIFATADWQNYDYQADLSTDSELSELSSIGKERLD
ncbi:hypothetical protein [Lactobacillus sp. ESL0677]|uniref:type II toxin-antitoxin system PemI/MazE family antitoxin n=1 Tax=Lactobacillus sp. ESL0677 TaxID=2983208 RepID=UPI0023F743DB|nr:hypothetical protein [Lactobacillus sp. ESL0677]WEV37470.1 hypothetical protein OZX76_02635 [Lactobacillus sp. ESL0677]